MRRLFSRFRLRRPRFRRPQISLRDTVLLLPVLLIFGLSLVEFVRVVAAWGTLQYAADVALRAGVSGQIEWSLFDTDLPVTNFIGIEGDTRRILDEMVPCLANVDARGTLQTIGGGDEGGGVQIFNGGRESLFATWYDGIDCDPENENHTQLRRDLLRLITMLYAVHEAAAPLLNGSTANVNPADINPADINPYDNLSESDVRELLFAVWALRPEDADKRGFFGVEICSTRGFINPVAEPLTTVFGENSRYALIQNPTDVRLARIQSNFEGRIRDDYSPPFCMLNEIPRDRALANAGSRWWDAGGPRDDVTIILRYNHTFLTPLLNANLIRLDIRLSRQNNDFRLPRFHLPQTPTATLTPTSPTPVVQRTTPLAQTTRAAAPIFLPLDGTRTPQSTTADGDAEATPLPYITPRPVSGE